MITSCSIGVLQHAEATMCSAVSGKLLPPHGQPADAHLGTAGQGENLPLSTILHGFAWFTAARRYEKGGAKLGGECQERAPVPRPRCATCSAWEAVWTFVPVLGAFLWDPCAAPYASHINWSFSSRTDMGPNPLMVSPGGSFQLWDRCKQLLLLPDSAIHANSDIHP